LDPLNVTSLASSDWQLSSILDLKSTLPGISAWIHGPPVFEWNQIWGIPGTWWTRGSTCFSRRASSQGVWEVEQWCL